MRVDMGDSLNVKIDYSLIVNSQLMGLAMGDLSKLKVGIFA